MAVSTWYEMAKKVGDLTRIVDEIQTRIEEHDALSNAHSAAGAVINLHNTSDPIQHSGAPLLPSKTNAAADRGTLFYATQYGKAAYKNWYGNVYTLY